MDGCDGGRYPGWLASAVVAYEHCHALCEPTGRLAVASLCLRSLTGRYLALSIGTEQVKAYSQHSAQQQDSWRFAGGRMWRVAVTEEESVGHSLDRV